MTTLVDDIRKFMSQSAPQHRSREWYRLLARAAEALAHAEEQRFAATCELDGCCELRKTGD
jgi:hypothetical protein